MWRVLIARGVPSMSAGAAQHGSVAHAQGTDCVFTTKAVVMSHSAPGAKAARIILHILHI